MLIYIVYICMIFIVSIFSKRLVLTFKDKDISGSRMGLIFLLFVQTLILGFRSVYVGTDSYNYANIYKGIGNANSFIDSLSIGDISAPMYTLFAWLINQISNEAQIFMVCTAICINYFLYCFIKNHSCDYYLSIYLWVVCGFFYMSMNGNRQMMALIIAIYGISILFEKFNSIRGYVLCIIAIGLHISSLIVFLLFLLAGVLVRISKTNFALGLYAAMGGILFLSLLDVLAEIVFLFAPKYSMYINGTSSVSILGDGSGQGRIIILYLLYAFFCILWLVKNKKVTNEFTNQIIGIIFFVLTIGILRSTNELINRIVLYGLVFNVVLIPEVINSYTGYTKIILKFLAIIGFGVYGIFILLENKGGVVPYTVGF